MFRLLLFAAMSQPPADVRLEDAHRFGVVPGTAVHLATLAKKHPEHMRGAVIGWNTAEQLGLWEVECERRFEIWNALARALDGQGYIFVECGWFLMGKEVITESPVLDVAERIEALHELRRLIGPENYAAGLVPKPTPTYRVR